MLVKASKKVYVATVRAELLPNPVLIGTLDIIRALKPGMCSAKIMLYKNSRWFKEYSLVAKNVERTFRDAEISYNSLYVIHPGVFAAGIKTATVYEKLVVIVLNNFPRQCFYFALSALGSSSTNYYSYKLCSLFLSR